MLLEDLMKI